MKKKLKIVLLIVIIIIAIFSSFLFYFTRTYLAKLETGEMVSDYDKKIDIWKDDIPYNSKQSKISDMKINYDDNIMSSGLKFLVVLADNIYSSSAEEDIDTFTYLQEIRGGYAKDTYEDVPYIIPYLVSNSSSAVIIVPGGGYGYKSINGEDKEGKDVALMLNKNGINAFVLWYRSNPYERPVPQIDLQRAVRYIRYHSEDFKIDKDEISLIGFSAGGNQVGSYINLIQGNDFLPDYYIKDEIDLVDDYVKSAAMIYPALSYNRNVNMLFASYDGSLVNDEESRINLLKENDLVLNFNSSEVLQFVAYGTADKMVGMDEAKRYITKARDNNTEIEELSVKNQEHGFDVKYYDSEYINWLKKSIN